MAEADKDGRAAQIVGDLMATAVMAVNEAWREAVRACPCGRPDCIATASPPVWHPATLGVNEFGTPVSIHVCRTPGPSVASVPNQPATPRRSVRIPDETWEALRRIADERGETITAVILRAIRQYLRHYPEA